MIYKNRKTLDLIYNFIKKTKRHLKNNGHLYCHGSFIRYENKYVTDIDLVLVIANNDIKKHFNKVVNYLDNKKIVFEDLKIDEVPESFLKKNGIYLNNFDSKETQELYRRWNLMDINNGVKVDENFNFLYLEDLIEEIINKNNGNIVLNFFYNLYKDVYVPISIAIHNKKYYDNSGTEFFDEMIKLYNNGNYIKTYKRISSCSNYLMNNYKLSDIENNNLMTIINIYKKNIENLNFYSSIKTQISLVGELYNYKLNVNFVINNLIRIVDKKIKDKLLKLKNSKLNYLDKISELNYLIEEVDEYNNMKIKPQVDKDYKIIKKIFDKIDKLSKKSKKKKRINVLELDNIKNKGSKKIKSSKKKKLI